VIAFDLCERQGCVCCNHSAVDNGDQHGTK